MSIPLWIVLPVLTPLAIITAAVALQHLERIVLPSSQIVPVDVELVADGGPPGGSGER
jgi:hypothetical protein